MFKNINGSHGIMMHEEYLPVKNELFEEAVILLQELISTPSFSGEEAVAASLVQNYLSRHGIKATRQGNNIWCYNRYYTPNKPTILLNSHLDTVKPNEGYTRDPFSPGIGDGRLYGLGSNDAGGCLVSLLACFIHFYNCKDLGFNLCMAATAEEENSGNNGIKSILPLLGKLDLAIVGEPTLLQMAVAEKGNLVIDCLCTGRSGHAAREEGDNAIVKCMSDLQWFQGYRFGQSSVDSVSVKMTITAIHAGLQHNIIPAKCDFTVDIRNDDTFTHQQILNIIKKHIRSQIKVRPGALEASSIDINHPIVKTGIAIGCHTYSSPTTSDQAWLNFPSVKIGPGDSARSHSSDEFIYLSEINQGISCYIKLLETLPLIVMNDPHKYKSEVLPHDN